MSVATCSGEPAPIQAADFIALPALFDQWALAAGATEMQSVARDALQAIGRRASAGLYVLQGARPVPVRVREVAWVEALEVLDTDGGKPVRIPAAMRATVLAAIFRAYAVDQRGSDEFMRAGDFVFRLGAVGVDRKEAANALGARGAADQESPHRPALVLVSGAVQSDSSAVVLTPTKAPGAVWQESDLRELLRQYGELQKRGTKTVAAHEELATAWNMGANSIKTYLTKARALAVPAGVVQHRA